VVPPPGCYTRRMPRISPFRRPNLRPIDDRPFGSGHGTPYDVIGPEAVRMYMDSSPFNVVHLDRPADEHAADYRKAAELLADWRASGVLVQSLGPVYYAYEMRFRLGGNDRSIRGLFLFARSEPWGGQVIPHEHVLSGPVAERLALLRATRANLSAVYGVISGPCRVLAECSRSCFGSPEVDGDGRTRRGASDVAASARSGAGRSPVRRSPPDRRWTPPLHDSSSIRAGHARR